MSKKQSIIAIEVNGVRYERVIDTDWVTLSEFDELFCEAGYIEEGDTLRGLDSTQQYMLDY